MNLKHYYWYFKGSLSPKFCDEVIKKGLATKAQRATTGTESDKLKKKKRLSTQDIKQLKKVRNSNLVFLSEEWLYRVIAGYAGMASRGAGWNFQYDYTESPQFTIYKKNHHYTWHMDAFQDPYKFDHKWKHYRNKIRKLSLVAQLTDPKEFEGGELQFDYRNSNDGSPAIATCEGFNNTRGSVIVFPSFVYHRIKPLLKGTRYSLVAWILGNPYV